MRRAMTRPYVCDAQHVDDTDETTQAIVRALHATLRERGATLATAESLTGGLLAGLFTAVPGASATYAGGLVTYATELKQGLLGVPDALVAEHGVVSAPCAEAMAQGARR